MTTGSQWQWSSQGGRYIIVISCIVVVGGKGYVFERAVLRGKGKRQKEVRVRLLWILKLVVVDELAALEIYEQKSRCIAVRLHMDAMCNRYTTPYLIGFAVETPPSETRISFIILMISACQA